MLHLYQALFRNTHTLSKRLIRIIGASATVVMLAVLGMSQWTGAGMLDRMSGAQIEALAREVAERVAFIRFQSTQKIDFLAGALAARHENPAFGDAALKELMARGFAGMPELARLWMIPRPIDPAGMPDIDALAAGALTLARDDDRPTAGGPTAGGPEAADYELIRKAAETGRTQTRLEEANAFRSADGLSIHVLPVLSDHEVVGVIGYCIRTSEWGRIGEQLMTSLEPAGVRLAIVSASSLSLGGLASGRASAAGTYLFDDGDSSDRPISPEEIEALRSGVGFSHLRSAPSGALFRRAGMPVPDPTGESRHYVLLDTPVAGNAALLDDGLLLLGGVSLAALVLFVALLGRTVHVMVGVPLERIRAGIKRLDRGEGDIRLPASLLARADQIGDIARTMEALGRSESERRELLDMVICNARDVERMMAAIDAALDTIIVLDADQCVIYANQAACVMVGAPDPDAVLGRHLNALEHPDTTLQRAGLRVIDTLERDGFWEGVFENYRTAFGQRIQAMEARFTRRPNGDIVIIGRDVSSRLAAATEKADLERRLSQRDKMDAIGRLAGGIAHDFNNLLGAIVGYADFLVADLPAGSTERDYAGRIRRVCDRAKDMVQQILAFSRAGEATLAPTSTRLLLTDVGILLRTSIPSSVDLLVDVPDRLPAIHANGTQLVQVLVNLAINARDALPEETGRIAVRASVWNGEGDPAAGCGAGWVTHKALPPAHGHRHVMFEVADNGCGMTGDVIAKAFDPFYTTKEQGKGTGLGLAMVFGIVEAHRGGLVVCSRPGGGTVLRVYIPAGEDENPAAEPVEAVEAPQFRPRRRCRVLVVDDEGDMGDMVSIGLERLGHAVTVCADPQAAIDAFTRDPQSFDVMITDQTMPGISGVALIRRLKAQRPDLPCILYTGYSRLVDQSSAQDVGADAFFLKPIQIPALAKTVEQLVEASPVAAPPLAASPGVAD